MSAAEKAAEALYTAIEWSGCDGSKWSRVPTGGRRKWLDAARALADANLLVAEPRVLPDVETVAQALHEADNARLVGAPHETVWLHLARAVLALFADAPTRAEVEVQALREFAERATPNMADAWGKNSTWLTTGTKVADLVRDWLLGAAIERGEGS